MATKLHHVNLCSNKVPEMDRFYREVLDVAPIPGRNEQRVTNQGYSGEVAFVTDGATEVHLAAKDLSISFRTGQAINPVEKGHIAFRTDDIAEKARNTSFLPVPTRAPARPQLEEHGSLHRSFSMQRRPARRQIDFAHFQPARHGSVWTKSSKHLVPSSADGESRSPQRASGSLQSTNSYGGTFRHRRLLSTSSTSSRPRPLRTALRLYNVKPP